MTGSLPAARRSRAVRVAAACVVQLALVAVAVAPWLSARLTGEQYRLQVAPVDPVDPFRGAYVDLEYPGLTAAREQAAAPLRGTVFVPLQPVRGSDLWQGGTARTDRPSTGPYLQCDADDWRLRCGIESLFASQDDARRLERELADGAVARIRVDGRGHAALVGLEPPR